MSTFTVVGFLALAQGRRVMSTRPGGTTRTWHAFYVTSVQCADSSALPGELRIYSPMNDVLHPDHTIAFVHARAHITANGHVQLDASHLIRFPGDPEDESYENSIPDFPYPLIIALGNVSSRHSHTPNGSRVFPMSVSDYVRDSVQSSNIASVPFLFHETVITYVVHSCLFNSERPRWKNTNVPYPGTIIHVVGVCSHVTQDGLLALDVENIILNVPSTPAVNMSASTDDSTDQTSSKKRKFSAFACVPTSTSPKFAILLSYPCSYLFSHRSRPTASSKPDLSDDDSVAISDIKWEK
jgi:hypothetical protein